MRESYTDKAAIDRACENATRCFFAGKEPGAELADEFGRILGRIGKADRANRLVKAAKSPTNRFPGVTGAFFNRKPAGPKPAPRLMDQPAPGYAPDLRKAGTWAVVEKRDWCGEYRLRLETRPGAGVQTPDNSGDRITAMLTERGARKISESCYFMACKRGGFTTFATLTLTQDARDKLARREWQATAPMQDGWLTDDPVAIEPARAKQAPLGPAFTESDQVSRHNRPRNIGGPFALLDQETGRPYTPIRGVWSWSVQKEASRFFEAAGKMYQRGWQYRRAIPAGLPRPHPETGAEFSPITGEWETVKVPGSRKCIPKKRTATTAGNPVTWLEDGPYTPIKFTPEPLAYLWVAENPDRIDTETGEYLGENPHLHLLMKWRVDYRHFRPWARRLEKLWGQGMAHLEKIKDPGKAGSYVAKAAGYLSKAQGKGDQGEIRGNRYGISSRARAPGWMECERHQVGLMGWLLAEAHETWNNKHGKKIARREYLKKKLTGGEIRTRAGKVVKLLAETRPEKRQAIGQALEKVRAEIEPLPRISKYAALFKSQEQKDRFFTWAKRRGWSEESQESLWRVEWRQAQLMRRNGSRLGARPLDVRAWFAMIESGAVECGNDDDFGIEEMPDFRAVVH